MFILRVRVTCISRKECRLRFGFEWLQSIRPNLWTINADIIQTSCHLRIGGCQFGSTNPIYLVGPCAYDFCQRVRNYQSDLLLTRRTIERGVTTYLVPGEIGASPQETMSCGDCSDVSTQRRHG